MIRHQPLLLALGCLLVLSVAPIAALGDLGARIHPLLALWGIAHAAYLGAAWRVTRSPTHAPSPDGRSACVSGLGIVLGAGLLARLLLIPAEPTLSEDLYRYLWDGRLVAAGMNPFLHPPSDPTLGRFQDGLLDRLNHRDVPTIYPPGAQLLFGATAGIATTPIAWKLTLLVLETALVISLLALLRRRRLPPERILLYYWNPLVLIESYGSGHLDLAAASFLLAAIALAERRRAVPAGVAFGLAALTKYVPALLAAYFLRRRSFALLAAAAVTTGLLFAPFAGAGRSLWDGLTTYARHWEFNGALYTLVRAVTGSGESARGVLAVLLALVVAAIAWRARSATSAGLGTMAALLLLSPTVFPWYAIPALAFLPLHADAGMLVLSGLLPLSYAPLPAYRETGAWSLPDWVMVVEYGGAAAAWIGAALLRRLRPRPGRAQAREAAWTSEATPT